MKATKEGKRFCPDSKGIPEQVIEEAFVESYRMLWKKLLRKQMKDGGERKLLIVTSEDVQRQ